MKILIVLNMHDMSDRGAINKLSYINDFATALADPSTVLASNYKLFAPVV